MKHRKSKMMFSANFFCKVNLHNGFLEILKLLAVGHDWIKTFFHSHLNHCTQYFLYMRNDAEFRIIQMFHLKDFDNFTDYIMDWQQKFRIFRRFLVELLCVENIIRSQHTVLEFSSTSHISHELPSLNPSPN